MLKQTIENPIDPGALLINGANVQFANADQFFTQAADRITASAMKITIQMHYGRVTLTFVPSNDKGIDIARAKYMCTPKGAREPGTFDIHIGMGSRDIEHQVPKNIRDIALSEASDTLDHIFDIDFSLDEQIDSYLRKVVGGNELDQSAKDTKRMLLGKQAWIVKRSRCFLDAAYSTPQGALDHYVMGLHRTTLSNFIEAVSGVIHVSAQRKQDLRNFRVADIESGFPGTFEDYTAAVVEAWERARSTQLDQLTDTLQRLDLTSSVSTRRRGDAEVEISVARPQERVVGGRKPTMVSLADVGVGISHVLPILVALEVAERGQIVYIEHPEGHLHPRAEYGLAEALARAANRGVRVVLETHSSLLLLHIQTLVARGKLDHSDVTLHWFTLDKEGFTSVTAVKPDEHGRTGDWPEDFADIEMNASSQFIRAARGR